MAEMSVFFHDALADHHSGREEHHMLFVGQLSEGDRRELRRLLRHANAPLSFRARLLVLSADGFSVPAISQMLGCCRRTVRRWIHAFRSSCGLLGLIDSCRGGLSKANPISAMSVRRPRRLVPAVPLSVAEIRRLLERLVLSPDKEEEFVLHWSAFRRYKQALAMVCHYERRGATPPKFEQVRL
jgi:hypothetical protein